MNARAVVTATGGKWHTTSLRQLLRRPRLAGIAVYRGEEIGPGQWPPVLDEGTWRAVVAILADPARHVGPGNEPCHLLSGIAECGVCADGTKIMAGGYRSHSRYRCRSGAQHLGRAADAADEWVGRVVAARLARPDAADLLTPARAGADVAALHREAATLRHRLSEQAAAHARGTITTSQLETGSAILASALSQVEAALATEADTSPLQGVAGRRDAAQVWAGLELWRQRAILRVLVTPVLMPARGGRQSGGGYFDHESVEFRWH